MRSRFFALSFIAALLLGVVGLAAGDTSSARAKKSQVTRLVSLLPESDGIAVFDSKLFLSDGLPRVLSANPTMLGEIMARIDSMQDRTGIDLRKFDQVAVGVAFRAVSPTEMDYEPVVLAGGDINAGALVAAARIASHGTSREETINGRNVLIFTPKDIVQKTTVKPTNSKIAAGVDHVMKAFSKEIAVTAMDQNTLAIGTLPRVRETLDAVTHVSPELTNLLTIKETAVMSFASKVPGAMARLLPLDDDTLGEEHRFH